MIDRVAVSRALAKAIAYKACGKQELAEQWAAELVRLLECADILRTEEEREEANDADGWDARLEGRPYPHGRA